MGSSCSISKKNVLLTHNKMKSNIVTAVGVFVLGFALQVYWTYVTWQYIGTEKKMERRCDKKNPYDWILEWYNWGNIISIVCLLLIAASWASFLSKLHK